MLIKFLKITCVALLVLAMILGINVVRKSSRQLDVPKLSELAIDANVVAEHLAGAVRPWTIYGFQSADLGAAEFEKLHRHLESSFPHVHRVLKREKINGHGLLYTWEGKDAKAKPILLLAHQDVVPIAPGTEGLWQEAPFAGIRKDGFVWGRGAWDNKSNLVTQLHAAEMLLASGFQPTRTVYFALTQDEEVSRKDAQTITELLMARGVRLDFVLDEGLMVSEGLIPGVAKPVAMIGVAEKGYLTVELTAAAIPGHSSMPPATGTSAIAQISTALNRLETQQFPAALSGVGLQLLDTLAPEMQGMARLAMSNLWLFEPLVRSQLERAGGSSAAMLRTTTALTIVRAGNKENVLPGVAEATVNFRLMPGDTEASVLTHVKRVIANDAIEVKVLPNGSDPSPVLSTDTPAYQLVNRTIREIFPETLVAPGLMIAATDSRRFVPVSDQILKFSPVRAKKEDMTRFHGTNERISEANLVEMVRFYHRFLSQAAAAK